MPTLAMITNKADIENNSLEKVRVIGKYIQMDVRQRPKSAGEPPVYLGHVALELSDGTQVLIYPVWHAAAKRTTQEINQFENKQVSVVGTLFAKAPSDLHNNAANLMMHCLTEVESIDVETRRSGAQD